LRLRNDFQILPSLRPREIHGAASLLGSHAEGPYIHPSKKGAHNASLFHQPSTSPEQVYGDVAASSSTLKLVTLAPELESADLLVQKLTQSGIRVSLGHSTASYTQGLAAIRAGATCLTHTLNAMAPLHHRDPGLAGLVTAAPSTTSESPYFSIITDGNHLHPSVATMLFRANPGKCIVITDSIELAGLPDGSYPGHAQIPHNQVKQGSRVVIEGTETLIGGCAGLGECVRNLLEWSGCEVAEAARCATENVADFMGDNERGRLKVGRRADFVVLSDVGEVVQTWISGRKVWEKL
jgi:N-acetylglucosamine-6-phosphate deacetylase